MNITDHIQFSALKLNFRWYHADNNNFVIFLHGMGERGPIDGSKINLIEAHGWPGFAKGVRPGETVSRGSVEYPFNIIAFQCPDTTTNWNNVVRSAVHLCYYLGAEFIQVTGLSMGGIGTYDLINKVNDPLGKIIGFVCCCGNENVSNISNMNCVRGMHWHGEKDATLGVDYTNAKKFVDAYNAYYGQMIEFISLPNVQHNAWDYAYQKDPGLDKSLTFILKNFTDAPRKLDFDTGFENGKLYAIDKMKNFLTTI